MSQPLFAPFATAPAANPIQASNSIPATPTSVQERTYSMVPSPTADHVPTTNGINGENNTTNVQLIGRILELTAERDALQRKYETADEAARQVAWREMGIPTKCDEQADLFSLQMQAEADAEIRRLKNVIQQTNKANARGVQDLKSQHKRALRKLNERSREDSLEIKRLDDKLEEEKDNANHYRSKCDKYKKEIETLKEENDKMEDEISKLKEKCEALEGSAVESKKKEEENAQLKEKCKALEDKIAELEKPKSTPMRPSKEATPKQTPVNNLLNRTIKSEPIDEEICQPQQGPTAAQQFVLNNLTKSGSRVKTEK